MSSAWVPGYQNDVFISYSKVDNNAPAGWVNEFVKHLRNWLDRHLGEPGRCQLWWDDKSLDRTVPVTDTITREVQNSALLCVLLSPGYLKSDWCKDERTKFLESVRLSSWPDRRIFVVDIYGVCRTDRPAELQDMAGFDMFEEGSNGRPVQFDVKHDKWNGKIDEITRTMKERLQELKAAAQPQALSAKLDPWLKAVRETSLWQPMDEGQGDRFRKAAESIVIYCREAYLAARDAYPSETPDPWLDEQFPVRVLKQLAILKSEVLAEIELALPERALLITAPFVREAVFSTARHTTFAEPQYYESGWAGAPQRTLRVIRDSMPQVVRKLDRLTEQNDISSRNAVSSWMLHRALMGAAEVWIANVDQHLPQSILNQLPQPDGTNTLETETFARQRLLKLARCIHSDPQRLQRIDEHGELEYPAASPLQELLNGKTVEIREQVVGILLCVAGWLAIDIRTLDPVLIDHVGLSEHLQLDPDHIVKVCNHIICRPKDGLFVWSGKSPHAAIDKAIKDHVSQFRNEVLDPINLRIAEGEATLDALRELPKSVSTADLTADRVTIDGTSQLAFDSGNHVTFRLAQTEVRELLMGERLYGDPTLAIRELYQNALDACRYREARLIYLDRIHNTMNYNIWFTKTARIRFRQDTDEQGREFIQCEDTGIGMDRRTIEHSFAQAGSRFADTTEFLEEQARWLSLKPPVEFYPNSQFGIGVFSYFMLADELRIQTRRLGPNGRPEPTLLDVRVSGSGSLFHIREQTDPHFEQEPQNAGTIVTLYLSKTTHTVSEGQTHPISVYNTLRDLLWLSEYPTSVTDPNQTYSWQPNELHLPPDMSDIRFSQGVTADSWWLNQKEGRILSDGVVTEQSFPFIVINLRRAQRPELTADRRRVRDHNREFVDNLLRTSLSVLAEPPPWANFDWFWSFGEEYPNLLPELLSLMDRASTRLPIKLTNYDGQETITWTALAAVVGCIGDRQIPQWIAYGTRPPNMPAGVLAVRVGLWRLAVASGIRDRFDQFAAHSLAISQQATHNITIDLTILSRDLNGQSPWLEGQVTGVHVLQAAAKLSESPRQVLARLATWAKFCELQLPRVEEGTLIDQVPEENDSTILSRDLAGLENSDSRSSSDLSGQSPWLEGQVTGVHVLQAAAKLSESPRQVLTRLERWAKFCELTLPRVEENTLIDQVPEENDFIVLSKDFKRLEGSDSRFLSYQSRQPSWLESQVTGIHVLQAAAKLSESPRQVLTRLERWAKLCELTLPRVEEDTLIDQVPEENDFIVLSRDLNGQSLWLEGQVTGVHVLQAAAKLSESPRQVLTRLERWAKLCELTLPRVEEDTLIDQVPEENDFIVLSRDLNGQSPWLEGQVTGVHVLQAAAKLSESPRQVLIRLERWAKLCELTLPRVEENTLIDQVPEENDSTILSRDLAGLEDSDSRSSSDLSGQSPWLEGQVTGVHVLQAAAKLSESPRQVLIRLERWAKFCELTLPRVEEDTLIDQVPEENDSTILSRDLNGQSPWLEGQVTGVHVLQAAAKLSESPRQVLIRLERWAKFCELQLPRVEENTLIDQVPEENDFIVLSRDFKGLEGSDSRFLSYLLGQSPWLEGQVTGIHVLQAAAKLSESPRQVLTRLERWAKLCELTLPRVEEDTLIDQVPEESDFIVLSKDFKGLEGSASHSLSYLPKQSPWLEGQVTGVHVLQAAAKLSESPRQVLTRLERWAKFCELTLPRVEEDTLIDQVPEENDFIVLSRDWVGFANTASHRALPHIRLSSWHSRKHEAWLERHVTGIHVLRASIKLGESPHQVITRLERWAQLCELDLSELAGIQLDERQWNRQDRIVLSQNLDGREPTVDASVTRKQVRFAAWILGELEENIMQRLAKFEPFGLQLPNLNEDPFPLRS